MHNAESSTPESSLAPTVDLRLVQFAPRWLDPEGNTERLAARARTEAADGADLVVFPELSNIGYVTPVRLGQPAAYDDPAVDADEFRRRYEALAEDLTGPFVAAISAVTAEYGCHIVAGMARGAGGQLFNSAILVGPAGVVGVYDKVHIPPQEKPYFAAGDQLPVFATPLGRIGLSICYDSRFPEVSRSHARNGADLGIVVYAGTDAVHPNLGTEKSLIYRSHVRAQENGFYFAMCNRVGVEGPSRFVGHSAICGPSGLILATGGGEETTVRAELTAAALDEHRRAVDVFTDLRPSVYANEVTA